MVPPGVDHVVDEHAGAPFDLADDLSRLDDVLLILAAGLVDEREVAVQRLRVFLGHLHPAGVRRDHHDVVAVLGQCVEDDGHRGQVIDRPVEEALDLSGVQIDTDHALGAGGLEHVREQCAP